MTLEYITYHDATAVITGKASSLNSILKVPVTIAAELVQYYHISEIPYFMYEAAKEWLKENSPRPDLQILPIFKPYEELEKMIQDVSRSPVFENHVDVDVSETDPRGIGFLKDLTPDPIKRSIKGFIYFNTKKLKAEDITRIKKGDVIDVSIGGRTMFGPGGSHNGKKYFASQINITLNHLAYLPHAKGRCPSDKCGVNRDSAQNLVSSSIAYIHPITDQSLLKELTDYVDGNIGDHENESLNTELLIPLNTEDLILLSDLTTFTSRVLTMTAEEELAKLKLENEKLRDSISSSRLSQIEQSLKDANTKLATFEKLCTQQQEEIKVKDAKLADAQKILDDQEAQEKDSMIKELIDSKLYKEEELKDMCVKEMRIIHSTLKRANGNRITDAQKKQFGFPKPDAKNRQAGLTNTPELLTDAAPTFKEIYGDGK